MMVNELSTIKLLQKYINKKPIKVYDYENCNIKSVSNEEYTRICNLSYLGLINMYLSIEFKTEYAQTTTKGLSFL